MGKLLLLTTLAACLLLSDSTSCKKVKNNRPTSYLLGEGLKKSIIFPLAFVGTQATHMGTLQFYSREGTQKPVLMVEASVTISVSGGLYICYKVRT